MPGLLGGGGETDSSPPGGLSGGDAPEKPRGPGLALAARAQPAQPGGSCGASRTGPCSWRNGERLGPPAAAQPGGMGGGCMARPGARPEGGEHGDEERLERGEERQERMLRPEGSE